MKTVRRKRLWISCLMALFCLYCWLASRLVTKSISPIVKVEGRKKVLFGTSSRGDAASQAIVTMFTTIRDRKCRDEIHSRLIRNWAALSPALEPVLFVPSTEYNTSSWKATASSYNWTVRILYELRHHLPIVKAMFQHALSFANTPFIGYANADILFDRSLISTLRHLHQKLDVANQMMLIVGRRRNVAINKIDLGSGDNLTHISSLDYVKFFHGRAQDYFIVSRRGLPWQEIPDFVVGRNGYDNWLVARAQDWNITLVDASKTILALHQCGKDGYLSGSRTVPKETRALNIMLAGKFNYGRGTTSRTSLYTKGECSSAWRRLRNSKYCNQIYNITLVRRPNKAARMTKRLGV